MANTEHELAEEVIQHTGVALSVDDVLSFLSRGKRQIRLDSGVSNIDYWSDPYAEDALFWLTCIFVVGELTSGSGGFSIGELEVSASSSQTSPLERWYARYDSRLAQIGDSTRGFVVSSSNRADRQYKFDAPLEDL
jgi:hypothetical protein